MKLDTFFTPCTSDVDKVFDDSYIIMIDVFRATSTICAAINNGAKEVIPVESIEKAVKLYHGLDKKVSILGGERHSIKPSGFDAGNSPLEYYPEVVRDKSIVLSTTNGTKIFKKGRNSKGKFIGAFVNLNALTDHLKNLVNSSKVEKIIFQCAGNDGMFSYEDTLCAGAFIYNLQQLTQADLSDSAHAAMILYSTNASNLNNFLKNSDHGKKIAAIGLEIDIEVCLSLDRYPVVPEIKGNYIKKV